jgi:hypothetical protein
MLRDPLNPMTSKDRLLAVLHRQPTDRLCWTALVDDTTRSRMPAHVRDLPMIEFYRHLGCDILCFGNFGLPPETRFVPPCRRVTPDVEVEWRTDSDGLQHQLTKTPWGTLTATFRFGHPVKHPAGTLDELRILRNVWHSTRHEQVEGSRESYDRLLGVLGEDGLFVQTLSPSPVQQLLEYDMGLQGFYYLLQDHPGAMQELLDVMHRRRCEEYALTAERSPVEVVIPVENTSSNLISPAGYRQYSLPQLRDFVDLMHSGGKVAILHMCGLLKALLPEIKQTGLDGVHALTPPPLGDTPWGDALDILGEDCVLIGGFAPTVFRDSASSPGDIRAALGRWATPRVRAGHTLLNAGADGTPLPIEHFYAVRDWVDATAN